MFKHVLICVAPDHRTPIAPALEAARKLLDDGGKVTALSVIEEVPSYVAVNIPDSTIHDARADIVKGLRADLEGQGVDVEVELGHAARSITRYAGENGIDCIVLMSHRPDYTDYLIGQTAARVVRHAQCSVVILR